jgi:hypothetical protein
MIATVLLSTLLVFGTVSAVTITVLPLVVEPDFTPFFSVRCSLLEQEGGLVTAISLYRRPSVAGNAPGTARELVAELRGAYLSRPRLAPGFENLLVQGQISAMAETEFGTFLEVTWPTPKAQDLGLYICESTTLGPLGAVTMFAEARVTSASPVTDRLLATVSGLQADVANLNRSLTAIHNDIKNISSVIQQQNLSRNEPSRAGAPPSGNNSQVGAPQSWNSSQIAAPTGNATAPEGSPTEAAPAQPPAAP